MKKVFLGVFLLFASAQINAAQAPYPSFDDVSSGLAGANNILKADMEKVNKIRHGSTLDKVRFVDRLSGKLSPEGREIISTLADSVSRLQLAKIVGG